MTAFVFEARAQMRRSVLLAAAMVAFCGLLPPGASAAAPQWKLDVLAPDRVAPGDSFRYRLTAINQGDASTDGTGALDVTLPAGLSGVAATSSFGPIPPIAWSCSDPVGASALHCDADPGLVPAVGPGEAHPESILFEVTADAGASGPVSTGLELGGGGTAAPFTASAPLSIDPDPAFGLAAFDLRPLDRSGGVETQAGGHSFEYTTEFRLNTTVNEFGDPIPDGKALRNLTVDLPPGFVGNPRAMDTCSGIRELDRFPEGCPLSSQVGWVELRALNANETSKYIAPIYNMVPEAGVPAAFGFNAIVPILLKAKLRSDGDYGLSVATENTPQTIALLGSTLHFWGVPADPAHDEDRGWSGLTRCAETDDPACSNTSASQPAAFLSNPTRCTLPASGLAAGVHLESWRLPPERDDSAVELPGTDGCESVPFPIAMSARPSTVQAETPSGLSFELTMPTTGLLNSTGIAESHLKKAVVTLPRGVTINPSSGEGLGACSVTQFAAEQVETAPGHGCPDQARIGSVEIETPLIEEHLTGSLYLAEPDDPATTSPGAENRFDSLISLYVIARSRERGVIVKLAGEVAPDPQTGRLTTTFDDLPQLPFNKFELHFREGGRAPLVTPSACGSYATVADLVPWSAVDPDNPTPAEIEHTISRFEVTQGVGGAPCPAGGMPPFRPNLLAGTINNAAGTYSPFYTRLSRRDGEQEFTRFSIKLPPGVIGKLAGIPFCPDRAIEAAKLRSASEELSSPSCPASSQVGSTLVGAGVGSVLTYVPGRVYLAGPFHGSAVSIVSITPGKVGPFDVGAVVVRLGLEVDPVTAEVSVDSVGSDPIPHIIKGIPVHAREIRVHVDRPEFVLNPTSCKPTSTASTVFGSGLDFSSAIDDQPVTASSRFQAADCGALRFAPKLRLSFLGGLRRAANPKLRAVLTMKPGEANIASARVTLPKAEFIANDHIRSVCTRVQYAANACPAGSVYGRARAFTPLLDGPLEGPVYLRSNPEQALPDLVAALHHELIDIDLAGHIDSVRGGGVRNTFELVPDAPVSRFVLEMQGGAKGLLENSVDLCDHRNRATVRFTGQNGKRSSYRPLVRPNCGGRLSR